MGCGAEPLPPLEELPLRDTLQAEPWVVASLAEEARLELALRFDEAREAGREAMPLSGEPAHWPEGDVRAADAALDALDRDAFVVARFREGEEGHLIETFPLDGEPPGGLLPELEGPEAEDTAAVEAVALAGPAGAVLAEMLHDSGATRLVRVEGWPVGALAKGDAVLVNGAWLVAMSPLTPSAPPAPPPVIAPPEPPQAAPQGITFNPYDLPGSVAQCSASLIDRCDCLAAGGCTDAEPANAAFASMSEECAFIAGDDVHASALCILALLEIEEIAECMKRAPDPCRASDLDSAVAFAMIPECVEALDGCIRGRTPEPRSSSCDSSCQRNCIDLNACDSDCNDSCNDQCSDTCESTCNDNQACDSCNSSSDSCGGCSSGDSGNCLDCSVRGRRVTHGEGFLWLLLPIFWVLHRTRRVA